MLCLRCSISRGVVAFRGGMWDTNGMRLPGRRCPPPTRGIVSTPASSSNEQIRRPPSPLARTLGRLRRSSAPPPGRERPQRRPGRLVCAAPIIMAVVRLLPRSVPHSRSGPRTRASACGTGRSYSTRRVFLGHSSPGGQCRVTKVPRYSSCSWRHGPFKGRGHYRELSWWFQGFRAPISIS